MCTGFNKFPHLADNGNREQLLENFLDLIEILDSYDQLGKLAVICNSLYEPTDPEHAPLFKAIEKVAVHIRGRHLGAAPAPTGHHWDSRPFVPACSAQHCPCPTPCDREAM